MKKTKVFKSGNSLAVRLPKEFAVSQKELCITKVGSRIILFPPDKKWDAIFEELEEVAELSKDFLKDRKQPKPQ
ncbi:antitoxin, partial [Thermovibrio sp.]